MGPAPSSLFSTTKHTKHTKEIRRWRTGSGKPCGTMGLASLDAHTLRVCAITAVNGLPPALLSSFHNALPFATRCRIRIRQHLEVAGLRIPFRSGASARLLQPKKKPGRGEIPAPDAFKGVKPGVLPDHSYSIQPSSTPVGGRVPAGRIVKARLLLIPSRPVGLTTVTWRDPVGALGAT